MKHLFIAVKNLKNNFSFYALYLLSVSFVITIFFAFASFSMNTVMLEKISGDGRVETMCNTISLFLMAFVVFYMSYSNRFFLRRRTKELGIYALLGYRKSTILFLLTTENLLSCFGAFIVGILFGGLFHKGIVFGITKLLTLSVNLSEIPFFNPDAIIRTACFVFAVVVILALSNSRFLFKASLMDLVRFEKSAEKQTTFHALPSIIGFLSVISGYGLALDILRGQKSIWLTVGFSPIGMLTLMLVFFGTVLFIASFLPYAVQTAKRNKRKFYTDTRIITSPNFIYRIRSNSRTLIMLTLLSGATLTVSSVMALSLYYPIAALSRIAPSEIECRIEKESDISAIKQIISEYSSGDDITFKQTDIYKVTSTAKRLPMEYGAGTSKGNSDNEKILRNAGFECISYSDYTALLKAQGKQKVLDRLTVLNGNECIFVRYQPASGSDETGDIYPLVINNEEIPVIVTMTTLDNPISFANSVGTLIVSDELYYRIAENTVPETKIFSINGKSIEDNEKLFQALSEYLNDSPYLQGSSHRLNEVISLGSSTFLLIGFLVVLFFIATGSILYFNNISAITDSKSDYNTLMKMGYTNKKIKKIIKNQVITWCVSIHFILMFLFQGSRYKFQRAMNICLTGSCICSLIGILVSDRVFALLYVMQLLVSWLGFIFIAAYHKKRVAFVFKAERKCILFSFVITIFLFLAYYFSTMGVKGHLSNFGIYIPVLLFSMSIHGIILKEHNSFPLSTILNRCQLLLILLSGSVIYGFVTMALVLGLPVLFLMLDAMFVFVYACNIALEFNLKQSKNKIIRESKYYAALWQMQKEEQLNLEFANFLHDDILQDLLSIKNMINKADQPDIQKIITITLDDMNTYIRKRMHDYHPVLLTKLTAKENYQNLLEYISQSFPHRNIHVVFECPDSLFLVEPYDIFIYRLLRELVTNTYKHSAGENAWISLTQNNGIIILCVRDNGETDADTLISADISKHRGLSLITDRVKNMDGAIKITNNFPQGICIQITLPMKGDVSYQYFVS